MMARDCIAPAGSGFHVAPETVARALDVLAALVARNGSVYVLLFERLERDFQLLQSRQDAVSRAMDRAAPRVIIGAGKAGRAV